MLNPPKPWPRYLGRALALGALSAAFFAIRPQSVAAISLQPSAGEATSAVAPSKPTFYGRLYIDRSNEAALDAARRAFWRRGDH